MMSKDRELSYEGQDIYCGIDVHKKRWSLTACTDHVVLRSVVIEKPFIENVLKYLTNKFPSGIYHAVYESGFSGFWACRQLSAEGINTIIVNAADIPKRSKE